MHPGLLRLVFCVLCVASSTAWADERDERARQELEKELSKMVSIRPPRVNIHFEGLDEPNYKLVEAEFTLDGAPLTAPGLTTLNQPEQHKLFEGELTPGDHVVTSRIVYEDTGGVMFSQTGGYRWKVGGQVKFEARRGLAFAVVSRPELVPNAQVVKHRFKLLHKVTAEMTAKLEDGTMPPPPKPQLVQNTGEVEEKQPAAAPVDPATAARQKKLAAAEERKRKAEEAKAARRAALEEKKRLAEEAKAARQAALEEKKRLAEEAKAARAAAVPAKPDGQGDARPAVAVAQGDGSGDVRPASAVADSTPSPEAPVEDAGTPEQVAAVAPAPEPVTPVAAATEPPAASFGLPAPLWVAGGALVLALGVFLISRRRR